MRLRFPGFTLYAEPRGHRIRCLVEMAKHEWVEHRWGTLVAHAMPGAARFAIGAPTPAGPTGFAAAVQTQTLTDDGGDCTVTQIEYVHLTWNPTGLGLSGFLWYEIQRLEEARWVSVAFLLSEEMGDWADYETARGVLASYRIRVVDQSHVPSAWSATVTATPESQACEWLFVTNIDPTENLGYVVRPNREHIFPDAPSVVLRELWGRDYQVAFIPLERRGMAMALDLTVTFGPTVTPGVRAFTPLRTLSTDPRLPYVCVLDNYGNRFLANLQIPRGQDTEPGGRYHAAPQITEITGTPYAPFFSRSHGYNAAISYNAAIGYNS